VKRWENQKILHARVQIIFLCVAELPHTISSGSQLCKKRLKFRTAIESFCILWTAQLKLEKTGMEGQEFSF
jgi:hypothetical protein